MLDITDFHGQNAPKEEITEVDLPISLGTNTLPTGEAFSSFLYLEGCLENASAQAQTAIKYDKAKLGVGSVLNFRVPAVGLTGVRNLEMTITSDTEYTLADTGTQTFEVAYLKGFKKRYATKNLSRTISVNGGNNIAVNSRYEVDLPSEFYEPDGSIKKGVKVRAEIFNNSGTGVAEWGETGNYTDSSSRRFAKASVVADKVIVQTGQTGIAAVSSQGGNGLGLTTNITSAPCQVIATLNDTYVLSLEPAQGSFERIVNAGLDVLEFTNNGDYAYVPLSDTDFDGDVFEYNSTTRFLRPKKSGKHIPSVFSHAEDGAGQARVKYVLVQADTAQGDNPVVATGVFTKQYTSDGGTQSIHTPINLDESKWYALYAENFTSGNVTYTSLVSPTSEPDLGDITDYAFIFSLERG